MKKATIPATITVALLISILEFGCTGGVYIPIIAMLASKEQQLLAYIYLVIYNMIFVLPLGIILVLFTNGFAVNKIEQFRQKHRKLMRLISGLVMIALAIVMILQIQ
jgi:cytochrome c biogenesis protein CcdA